MRVINVDEYISDLEQVRTIVRKDSKTVAIVKKLQHMVDEYAKQHGVERNMDGTIVMAGFFAQFVPLETLGYLKSINLFSALTVARKWT